jgi:hypothetical protein
MFVAAVEKTLYPNSPNLLINSGDKPTVAMHITVAWKDLETLSLKILNETEERIFK